MASKRAEHGGRACTRRRALGLLGATALAATLSPTSAAAGCKYKLSKRISLEGRLIVDTHCHIFNLADLPVEQFLRKVQFRGRGGGFLGQLISFVKNLQRRAVGYRAELLEIGRAGTPTTVAGLRARGLGRGDGEATDPETDALQYAVAQALAEPDASGARMRGFSAGGAAHDGRDKFASFLARKYGIERGADGSVSKITTRGWKTDTFHDEEEDEASRTLDWGKLLTRSRSRITDSMIRTFSPAKGFASVNLYTPALVDFEHWLGERPPTSLLQQIDLLERITLEQKGRLHGFVAYCPWRQVDDEAKGRKKTALDRVRDAILNRGFLGIKLYPPMGFRPIGNAKLGTADFPAHLAKKPYANGFGAALDRALLALYDLCVELDACIMVHTAPTQYAGRGYEERAHPKYWRRILAMPEYAKLRINLAHFGGFELAGANAIDFASPASWHHHVGRAVSDHDNVYADLSHFDPLLTDGCDAMRANLIGFLKAFPEAEFKVMYGSDWSFISRERFHGQYLEAMGSWLIRKVVGKGATYNIMGRNAANYLGLHPGQANRERLETFYSDFDIAAPDWMKLL